MGEPNVSDEDFTRLRRILLKPTAQRLDHLEERVDVIEETSPTADKVSAVLPEAVRISARKSQELATILAPVVESALDQSIARNRDRMASALYPLLGAMIRKSVAEAARDAFESINMILERALSMEGLQWRWESFRTGVPVSRIAFKRSTIFRTEHIFLIHNRTAHALCHLSIPEAMETDQLVFAGMAGAVTDFIKDAFFRNEPIGLRSIDVGEFTVWFEEGPEATVAVVIRGDPQPLLRHRLRVISEKLHAQFPAELKNAMVDEISILSYDSLLRESLLQQPRRPLEKPKRVGRIAAITIAVALLIWGATALNSFLATRARDARFDRLISHVKNSEALLTVSGRIAWQLYLQGVYAPNLLRTLPVNNEPTVLRILQERTVGNE